jgi:hypothetical protein
MCVRMYVCIQPAVWLRERSVPQVACPVAITVGVIIMGGERITMLYSMVACREACSYPIAFQFAASWREECTSLSSDGSWSIVIFEKLTVFCK